MAEPTYNLVNQNYLTATRASFELSEMPNTSFTVTRWNLPGINTGAPRQPTPFVDIPLRGDKLVFEPLTIEFIVVEDLVNWTSIYDWLVGITAPRRGKEFVNKPHEYMDGSITVYSSHNNKFMVVQFKHLVPISLSEIQFTSEDTETQYVKASATFMYQDFDIILER